MTDRKYAEPGMSIWTMDNTYHEVREQTEAVQRRHEDFYNKRVSAREPFKKDNRVWAHQRTGKIISKIRDTPLTMVWSIHLVSTTKEVTKPGN